MMTLAAIVSLAQVDYMDSPLTKYFSFIILGLMMVIGYGVWRLMTRKRKEEDTKKSLEAFFAEAEREARELKRQREEGGDGSDVLALPPEEAEKFARLKQAVEGREEGVEKPEEEPPRKSEKTE